MMMMMMMMIIMFWVLVLQMFGPMPMDSPQLPTCPPWMLAALLRPKQLRVVLATPRHEPVFVSFPIQGSLRELLEKVFLHFAVYKWAPNFESGRFPGLSLTGEVHGVLS